MKRFGYWVFGKDMYNVKLETLKKNGVTDIFLNYYAISLYGQAKVKDWIKKAKAQKINVHIWVQCFYNGKWINPKTANLSSKLKEIKGYAAIEGVKGIHLDYLRYPGNAYKTSGGAEAITNFVKKVRSQNPNVFLSCAVMPENEDDKKYYGQDISALGKIVDAIIPMQYKGNYSSGSSWLASTTKYFSKYATVWSGLQTYKSDDDPTQLSAKELLTDSKTCINNGAKGAILFRYGLSPNVNFTAFAPKTTGYSFKTIVEKAKIIKTKAEKEHKSVGNKWSYYVAKALITKKNVKKISFKEAPKPSGNHFNKKISEKTYLAIAEHLVKFVEKNKRLPNYITLSGKKMRTRTYNYLLAYALVYYSSKKKLPSSIPINTKKLWGKTTTTCSGPRYESSPHWTQQGAGYLGQINPYNCGPHSVRQSIKKFGINISESTLASWAGTTTSGTDHEGINTAIAMAAKQAGVKIDVEWKNFSELGSNDAARFKALGELLCQKNVAAFLHILYSGAGDYYDPDDECGHYEPLDRVNVETKYVRALNSLGSRDGYGYYGHLQDRTFNLEAQYISGISQKSVCILRKK